MNERSIVREQNKRSERSEQCRASERVSGASKRGNAGANGPILYASNSQAFFPLGGGSGSFEAVGGERKGR